MKTLKSFTLIDQPAPGDYALTFAWSDGTSTTATIHFGALADIPGGPTAVEQLAAWVVAYAVAYQQGLDQERQSVTASSLSAIIGASQVV